MKKLMKWTVALFMAIAVCLPAFGLVKAEEPISTKTATVTVTNVPQGATVTAYPVLVGKYNDHGLLGYMVFNDTVAQAIRTANPDVNFQTGEVLDENTVRAILTPQTAEQVSTVRNQIGTSYPMTYHTDGSQYAGQYNVAVPAGAYIVVVENPGDSTKVYNVGMVSASWSASDSSAQLNGGTVDMGSIWADTTVMKSQEPSIDKTLNSTDDDNETSNGAAFDFNSPIAFKVTTAIPNYNGSLYKNVVFNIRDTLSQGLSLITGDTEYPFIVEVAGNNVQAGDNTYTITYNENGYELVFNSEFVMKNIGMPVELNYFGKITDPSIANFNGTSNTVELEYSNNPSNFEDTVTKNDKTYQYTFDIDGLVNGADSEQNEEIVKVNEEYVKVEGDKTVGDSYRLAGAEFSIWAADENGNPVGSILQTVTSDSQGLLKFKGLDAGRYVIKETKAPTGYALNDAIIPVEISATYFPDGRLESYTILVNNQISNSYTINYESETVTVTPGDGNESFPIINTKIPALPSTGSNGAIIATGAGAALMVCYGIYYLNRKKREEKN